jgi:hypothetical protein
MSSVVGRVDGRPFNIRIVVEVISQPALPTPTPTPSPSSTPIAKVTADYIIIKKI